MKLSPDGQHIGLLASIDGRNVLTTHPNVYADNYGGGLNLNLYRQIGDVWANNERLLMRLDFPILVSRRRPLRASGLCEY